MVKPIVRDIFFLGQKSEPSTEADKQVAIDLKDTLAAHREGCVGGMDALIDENAKDKDTLALSKYTAEEDKLEKILENQQILKMPIVRNGKQATVGYQPEVWKAWE